MTLLQLVNKVLRGLREAQVADIVGTYPLMVVQFVNEAKENIEDIGPWLALRTTVNDTLTQDVSSLDLTGSTNERSYLLFTKNLPMAFITTANEEHRLSVVEKGEIDALNALDPDAQHAVPYAVAFARSNTGLTAHFFPTPDAAYTVRFVFVVPQDELDEATDEISIPGDPVWREALVLAMEERGEEFAGPLDRTVARAQRALGNAMMRDFGAESMTFEPE